MLEMVRGLAGVKDRNVYRTGCCLRLVLWYLDEDLARVDGLALLAKVFIGKYKYNGNVFGNAPKRGKLRAFSKGGGRIYPYIYSDGNS